MLAAEGSADLGTMLLRQLHRGYNELMSELWCVDRETAIELTARTGWSPRDHVAHICAWEALELARAEGRSGLREHATLAWEALRRGHRSGSLADSLDDCLDSFAGVHRRLVAVLTDIPDTVLRRPWHSAYPDTLAANIARNTYRHYAEHLALLRQATGQAMAAR